MGGTSLKVRIFLLPSQPYIVLSEFRGADLKMGLTDRESSVAGFTITLLKLNQYYHSCKKQKSLGRNQWVWTEQNFHVSLNIL